MKLFTILSLYSGAIFLALSYTLSRKGHRAIPWSLRNKWMTMEMLILFFFSGYLTLVAIVYFDIPFPTDLITSIIYLCGSFFVLLVMKITQETIQAVLHNEEMVRKAHNELHQAYESTIEGWGLALELRDRETEGHTRRVVDLTVRLARGFGMDEEEITHLRRGALLHDIGKMAIPDRILRKNGVLDTEERMEMEQHTEYGRRMLASIDYLKPALVIPYCHHERWDGSGYPQGLEGEEIPLAARIFAVADVWDALVTKRRYSDAWPREKAHEYIKKQAGSHFDPAVVEKFLEME